MDVLSMEIIKDLYSFGKRVYQGQEAVNDAVETITQRYKGDISTASADFYIRLVTHYINGKGATWNQNSQLILYYVENINNDFGPEAGNNAYSAALKFAKTKGRTKLEQEIHNLWARLSENAGTIGFEEWLRNHAPKKYNDHTVYKYVHALEKAGEWLGLSIDPPLLTITNSEEFEQVRMIIQSKPNYDEINQSHGHGDLSAAMSLYKQYISYLENGADAGWWPTLKEYDPSLSKEQWVDYLNNHLVSNIRGMSALAALYDIGGSATMRELEDKYGRTADFYRNVLGSISEKAVEHFGIAACNQKNAKTWPCMFFGRSVGKDRLGNYEWKIRPELFDALTEINIMQYIEPKQPSSVPFVLPDSFSAPVSRRFVNSLLAKPFVILTGNSGTGKTRIATRFAKYMGVQLEDGKNYELVSVGADWTDNTAILGYYNPMGNDGAGKYVDTAILRLFIRAKNYPQYPFFLILDEMNLSHVERYFADFLSHMETPETAFKIENYSDEEFTYPDNLFVIGTVNIDETTYMFSPKVLDRANVIEFKPDKESIFGMFAKQDFDDSIDTANDETIQAFMSLARKIRDDGYEKDLTGEADAFRQIYDILEENGFEFAYRTVKEICRYIYAANEIADAFGYNMNSTVDEQIVQKLLPKIYGNRRAIGDMLEKLAKLFEEKQYNLSLTKVRQMQRKLDNTQYVSFI